MASSYSTNLALTLPVQGELSGTWGTTVNTGITNMVDEALGYQAYTATGGSDTLTIPDGTTGVARSIYIQLNGTGGGTVNVPVTKTKMYFVFNNTSSAITFKVTSATGVSIPAAAKMALVSNGADIIVAQNYFAALTLGAALPVLSGGTGVTTSTGTGSVVLSTSPTLVTPLLGTPTSGTLSSCTVDGTNKVGYLNIPLSGTKTASYTLVVGDVGKFVILGTSGLVVVPASIFAVGDAISVANNTAAAITCTSSAVTAYLGGTNTIVTSFSLASRGVCTILYVTASVVFITGNVS